MYGHSVGDDEMWAIANAIARSQYKPKQFLISYVTLISVNILMFVLRKPSPVLASILLIVGYLFVTAIVWLTSMRVYGFMDRDGRSTADYIHYKKYGLYSLLCLIGPVVFFANRNNPNWFSVVLTIVCALINAVLLLFTQTQYNMEFGPGNGRYTFGLKVALSRQMSQEQLKALCIKYGIPF